MEIYQSDPYKTELITGITQVKLVKKKTAIACENTIFHAESGGQPSDKGTIKIGECSANIIRILKLDGKSFCVTDQKLPFHDGINIGAPVTQHIDWERRYKFMRCHTAAHILMAKARDLIQTYEAKGIGISDNGDKCFIRFQSIKLDNEQVTLILNRANELCKKSINVKVIEFDSICVAEEQFGKALRVDSTLQFPKNKAISLAIIDGIDVNPCGGTHVKDTSEIREIQLLNYEYDNSYGDPGESMIHYRVL